MAKAVFSKPFTQQEGMSQAAIFRAVEILEGGRLHRYNTLEGETSEASLLEDEYAAFQQAKYCIACTSGGQAMQIALRSVGLRAGDKILANAYTLAPVPGAMHSVGGVPVFVEIDDHWHTDVTDLRNKAIESGARFMLLSHMRGHIADMEAIASVCEEFEITLIEDCAHTMGAKWKGIPSGNFGKVGCFSNQTYKHMNSGEGGFITTDDEETAARAIMHSGSYMLYDRHGSKPSSDVFEKVKLDTPNLSARLDNLRAALLRDQLSNLDSNIRRWNERYQTLEHGLRQSPHLFLPQRQQHEAYVGSSLQFQPKGVEPGHIPQLVANCACRGVEIKWFGAAEPVAFTSRYDSWRYLGEQPELKNTKAVRARTCDMRVPLTFDLADCELIAEIICEEVAELAKN
ncbi:MAG: aminotransferase class I/II-fold pyridoxal phosphate-dependent enzyme [Pseudomonadota bacterium]